MYLQTIPAGQLAARATVTVAWTGLDRQVDRHQIGRGFGGFGRPACETFSWLHPEGREDVFDLVPVQLVALLVALQRRQVDARLAPVDQVQLVVATQVVALALGVGDPIAVEVTDSGRGALQIVDLADDAVDQGAQEERAAPPGVDVLGLDESGRLVGAGAGAELGPPGLGRVAAEERES